MRNLILGAATAAMLIGSGAAASEIKFNYEIGGFAGGGTVTGSFTGQDLNNDGYISSFIFAHPSFFEGSPFAPGLSEVTKASATYNGGAFDGGPQYGMVTGFSQSHDLTPPYEEQFPGFPIDVFFVLNYKLDGGPMGDDPWEGILVGQSDQGFFFAMGPFIPAPDLLGGGELITSIELGKASNGTPCVNDLACGMIHTVNPNVTFGGADYSPEFMNVSQVPIPASALLMLPALGAVLRRRRKG